MNIALMVKVLLVATAGISLAPEAPAQSTSPPRIELKPPSLEPTLKVYPTPRIQSQSQPPAAAAASCICTTQYDPVCARIPQGVFATFSNACQARCAGATEMTPGPC